MLSRLRSPSSWTLSAKERSTSRQLIKETQTAAETHVMSEREMVLGWEEDVKAMLSETYSGIHARMFEDHIEITGFGFLKRQGGASTTCTAHPPLSALSMKLWCA